MRNKARISRLFVVVAVASAAWGAPASAGTMPVGDTVAAPSGFVDFCRRNPGDCDRTGDAGMLVAMTPGRLAELENVQAEVNHAVAYRPDSYTFGRADYWNIPFVYGDCEDIALLKRRKLAALGWPRSSLLLTLARTRAGELHLVLVAVTDKGEYVLDNRLNGVVAWESLDYDWLGRQSRVSENVWVAVGPRDRHWDSGSAASGIPDE